MREYIDVETGIGTFTVELSIGGWGAIRYTVWDQFGEDVADGIHGIPYDSLTQVAEDLVFKYVQELEFID